MHESIDGPPFRLRIAPGPTIWAAAILGGLVGCRTPVLDGPRDVDDPPTSGAASTSLDHGYTLLLDLLRDEARVDQALLVKSPRGEIEDLLREIARQALSDRQRIETMLDADPSIRPGATGLPAIELDARNRIRNRETPGLLLAGGRNFETRMLLTQQKALQYLWAISKSLSVADPDRTRAAELRAMSARWSVLEDRARKWLAASDPTGS